MDILGIGPLELIFIILIMFIVLGPQQMVTAMRAAGKMLTKVRSSGIWRDLNRVRNLPQTLLEQAELDELKEIRDEFNNVQKIGGDSVNQISNAWSTPLPKPVVPNRTPPEGSPPPDDAPPSLEGEPISTAWTASSDDAPPQE